VVQPLLTPKFSPAQGRKRPSAAIRHDADKARIARDQDIRPARLSREVHTESQGRQAG
jgi:hypothetical protein